MKFTTFVISSFLLASAEAFAPGVGSARSSTGEFKETAVCGEEVM